MPPTAAFRFPSRTKKIDRRARDERSYCVHANTRSAGSCSIDEMRKERKVLETCHIAPTRIAKAGAIRSSPRNTDLLDLIRKSLRSIKRFRAFESAGRCLPSSTMTTLIECLVERMPTTIAISFLQTPALAAVDRPAARQGSKVTRHGLVVVVHAVRSRPIVTLGLGGITVADLSGAIVRVASMLPRQAAVDILRRVNRLAQGLIVSAVIAAARVSLRGKRHGYADVVTSLGTTQMLPQPLSNAAPATAASGVAVLASTVTLAGLVSATRREKNASVTIRSRLSPSTPS